MGTSITRMTSSGTISAVRCKIWSSTPPIEDCGTGTSIICTGTKDSMIGSTVRRRTRACGPATSGRGGGPTPTELLIKDVTGCLLAPWGVVHLVLHQLLLQRDRTARGVVELFSQGHCDAEASSASRSLWVTRSTFIMMSTAKV